MFGLLGKSLKHSFSKNIHESLGHPYQLIETDDLDELFASTPFSGLNVTIPYKEEVLSYCDVIDPLVKRTNSCNTIVRKNHKLYAYNTDYDGLLLSLLFHDIDLKDQQVAIIGNGATSRTVSAVAGDLGAQSIKSFARNPKEKEYSLSNISSYPEITVIINTTPVGMFPNIGESLPINIALFPNLNSVIDVIYNPLQTTLLLEAKEAGLKTMNGLYMLISQAVKSYELFHQTTVDDRKILSLYRHLKRAQSNIVFIGMPKSGKSLYSKIIADKMNRPLYDLDALLEAKFSMSIKEYFQQYGEDAFRQEEHDMITNLSSKNGVIISTGGGAILKKENIKNLKHNGVLLFIDAPLDLLDKTGISDHRPLLKDANSLEELYYERHQLYIDAADIVMNKDTLHTSTNIQTLEVLIYEYFGT